MFANQILRRAVLPVSSRCCTPSARAEPTHPALHCLASMPGCWLTMEAVSSTHESSTTMIRTWRRSGALVWAYSRAWISALRHSPMWACSFAAGTTTPTVCITRGCPGRGRRTHRSSTTRRAGNRLRRDARGGSIHRPGRCGSRRRCVGGAARVAPVAGDHDAVSGQRRKRPAGEGGDVVAVVADLAEHDQVEAAVGPLARDRTLRDGDVGRPASRSRAISTARPAASQASTCSQRVARRSVSRPVAQPGSNARRNLPRGRHAISRSRLRVS